MFCPLFRLHGNREPSTQSTGGPNEVGSFGEAAYGIIQGLLKSRERLRPYLRAQMYHHASATGIPIMHPLFFDFNDDAEC